VLRRPWEEGQEQTRATWYEPLEDQGAIDRAVHWVFGRPGFFLNTPGDIHILPLVLDAASRFTSGRSDEEMKAGVDELEMRSLFV
jgi:hypothetical protein